MDAILLAGPWLYPLGGVALGLAVTVGFALRRILSDRPIPPAGPPHHAVLVWGVLGAVVGVAGTVVGFGRLAVGARAATGEEVERWVAVMGDGMIVIVTPAAIGLGLLSASLLAWLLLAALLNRRLDDGLSQTDME